MKLLYPFLLIHLFIVSASGQNRNWPVHQKYLFEAPLTGDYYQMKRTIGSQLFHDDWYTGDITLMSGDTVCKKEIGYNAYEDELLWRPSKTIQVKLDKEQIDKFSIYDFKYDRSYNFCHLKGIQKPGISNIDLFARVLLENKLSLYVTNRVECADKNEQEAQGKIKYIEKLEPAKPCYYFRLTNHEFVVLNHLRKKSLYGAFPGFEEEIKTLLNQFRLSLNNEDDLVRIVELMNKYEIVKISD